jgi:hypothetical protein
MDHIPTRTSRLRAIVGVLSDATRSIPISKVITVIGSLLHFITTLQMSSVQPTAQGANLEGYRRSACIYRGERQ